MRAQNPKSKKSGVLKKTGWAVMLLLAVLVSLVVSRYLTLDPDAFFPEQQAVYMAHLTFVIVHVVASMLAILIGPFQFLPGIRKGRWLKFHRWLGRTYLLGILFGGLSGLYMAQLAYGGIVSRLGFGTLAFLWLYTGYRAYRHIRNKNIEQHRQWMMRNYALTFAGVMLRVWVPIFLATGMDFTAAYVIIAWFCWVPNLLVAEWVIRSATESRPHIRLAELPGRPGSSQKTVHTDQ